MRTILIVDDEFDLVSTLKAILEGEGYRAEACSNGRAALDRLKGEKPDMLLMDVMLPFVSGLEVLRVMKATPGLDGIPVVLMSSVLPRVNRGDYRWDAFLRKPFGLQELVRVVDDFAADPDRLTDAR